MTRAATPSPVPLGESFTTITIIKGAAIMSIAPGEESAAGAGWRIYAREPRLEEPSSDISTKSYWTEPASNLMGRVRCATASGGNGSRSATLEKRRYNTASNAHAGAAWKSRPPRIN